MAEDIIRVFRIVEYVGPRAAVEAQLERSIHGVKQFAMMRITARTVTETPEVLGSEQPTIEWEAREGMVTVYDHAGHYVGCMGIEAWKAQVQASKTPHV